jgi:hypothetical protein
MVNHLPIIFPSVSIIVTVTGFISKTEAVKQNLFLIFNTVHTPGRCAQVLNGFDQNGKYHDN